MCVCVTVLFETVIVERVILLFILQSYSSLFPPQHATNCTNEQEKLMHRLTLPPCSSLSCCRKHSCCRQWELHCWAWRTA